MKTVAIALLAAVAFAEPEAKPKAEADPYLLYGGYGGYGLGHTTYIGKREAEADPKAAADPYLLYGGYGVGRLGYYGFGKLKLIPRLLLTPTFSMVDMELDILAMLAATMDMVLDMDTLVLDTMVLDTEFMESALLMLSQKLTP